MELIDHAIHFVTDAMAGKFRKGARTPAVFHSLEAGAVAATLTDDPEIISAALLHDVVEDTSVTEELLRQQFPPRTVQLVLSETEDKRRDVPPWDSWKIRKLEAIRLLQNTDDIGVKILFLSDKLSNIRSIIVSQASEGDILWQKFNNKNPEDHHWYYRSIADSLTELNGSAAYMEYDRLIKQVFNEEKEKQW